ncbi:glutamine amidotransferase of anthranilate synthase [Desulfatibacillum aliphaticivorans]|uniref:Glutamine amidotransferase of anthranilate synthase n=1 Tax=Desulfatibacillum aliphaticivorans TaxID=218208 RepID=B8FA42_DESAL|nr:aminodeoxychorismate/anthranilate synthase component II [Desulfatibacillum aliphaticivorans]ACL03138.1 glutamine amidotransferase of anthranilate synthase [Desulfatibacillum aliphaticivorans]
MIIMIDNYDSFTYNLVQYLRMMGAEVEVYRNDAAEVDGLMEKNPKGVVISPGPGRPESAGVSLDLIKACAGKIPLLGVCLGHQSIGHAFGATIGSAKRLMHGKTSQVTADGKGVFEGIKSAFAAMRYHSLAIMEDTLPDCLEITARSDDEEIMGVRHREFDLEGIQFHPESIMTPMGKKMLRNFLVKTGEITN